MNVYTALIAGFSLGFGLILAIGAKDAFALKQGIRNQLVFWICLCCACPDAALIVAGVGGFASFMALYPWVDPLTRYAGALFLSSYALLSFKDAIFDDAIMGCSGDKQPHSLGAALLICSAFTWLNLHVYLDTVVLIGSVSAQTPASKLGLPLAQ